MNEVKKTADDLEERIENLHCGLTYDEIVKVAIMTAEYVKESQPMYIGNLNPKWSLWNNVIFELVTRI